jgi:vacuolar protein sorting-associated protein 29
LGLLKALLLLEFLFGFVRKVGQKMSAPYGELVVVLGDAHVGHRAIDIPDKFRKMLTPDKMQHLVSTGNLCSSDTYDFCRSVAPRMHAVRGDMDDYSSSMTSAEELVFEVGEFRLGVCHGHQIVPWGDREALGLLARRLDVDILITGHTHVCEAFEVDGTWFVNPGSITGAYTPLRDEVRPSFVLLSIQANTVKLYMYELNAVSGEVDITRGKFTKPSKNPFSSSATSFPNPSLVKTEASTVKSVANPDTQKRTQTTITNTEPKNDVPPIQKRPPSTAQNLGLKAKASPPPTSFEDALPVTTSKPAQVIEPIAPPATVDATEDTFHQAKVPGDLDVASEDPHSSTTMAEVDLDPVSTTMADVDLNEDTQVSADTNNNHLDMMEEEAKVTAAPSHDDNVERWDEV